MGKQATHSELIDAVGVDAVRANFEMSPQMLFNWRQRGIPPLRRVAFARLMLAQGVDLALLPADFIEAETLQGLRLATAVRDVASEGEAA